jgi:plastocyanin
MRIKRASVLQVPLLLCLIWIMAGCAGAGRTEKVSLSEQGKRSVTVEASSFKFEPSVIEVPRGDALTLKIMNVASVSHNFTIKDPQDRILRTVDLPPGETVTVEVPVNKAGTYEFYCDKPLHAALGMKGKIEVKSSP